MFTFNTGQSVWYTSPTGEQYQAVIKRITYIATGGLYWLHDENNIFMTVCRESDIQPMEPNHAN